MLLTCCGCSKTFANKSNLSKHKKNVCCKTQRMSKIICSETGCSEILHNHVHYIEHLHLKHNREITSEKIRFKSKEEFVLWKNKIERKTLSKFVKYAKTNLLKDGVKKSYLVCHRSNGYRTNVGQNRRRALKSQGSCKIGSTCPSRMEISEFKDLSLSVKFWSTHCGHTNDVEHLTLDKQTREHLASKLQAGVTFEDILDDVRNGKDQTTQRLMLLERKDLHNIAAAKNIPYNTNRLSALECSCTDGMIQMNMCEHNHACSIVQYSEDISNCSFVGSDNVQIEVFTDLFEVTVDNNGDPNRELLESRISVLLDKVRNINTKISDSKAVQMVNKLDGALSILNGGRPSESGCKRKISVTQKIEKQMKLVPTKRKSLVKKPLRRPNHNERSNIIQGLKSDDRTNNDHSYCCSN